MKAEKLFWEKFRPTSFITEKGQIPMILLPRIRKILEKGVILNMMFEGSTGLGKTTAARILLKGTDDLTIDCSSKEERGIEVVSSLVLDHCTKYNFGKSGQKIVFLEEFDNSTPDMRKALRGFIEKYSNDVRFIACVNNINKLRRTDEDAAVVGRFNVISFDPQNKEETEYLKKYQLLYLKSICKSVKFEVEDKILEKLINRSFPNFRNTVELLQELTISGDYESFLELKENENKDIFEFLLNGNNNKSENFFYVTENYPKDKSEDLLLMMGRPFFKYLIDNRSDIVLNKGLEIISLGSRFNQGYTTAVDPEMHVFYYLTLLKELLIK